MSFLKLYLCDNTFTIYIYIYIYSYFLIYIYILDDPINNICSCCNLVLTFVIYSFKSKYIYSKILKSIYSKYIIIFTILDRHIIYKCNCQLDISN